MTDARFANYATGFPGARIETVPSSPFNAATAPFKIAAGVAAGAGQAARLKPAAVIGFGGYPSVPVMLAADVAGLPTAIIEQNAVVGRANRLVMNQVRHGGGRLSHRPLRAARHVQDRADRQSAAARSRARCGARPIICPQIGGPMRLLVFGGSQGARALSEIVPAALTRLPHDIEAAPVSGAAMPARRYRDRCATIYRQCRDPRRARDLLRRLAAAHGGGAAGDRPLRRRHGGRADGDRPSRHPGAAARMRWTTTRPPMRKFCRKPTPAGCVPQSEPDARMFWPRCWAGFSPIRLGLARRAPRAHALATPNAAGKLADMVERTCPVFRSKGGRVMATPVDHPRVRSTSAPSISSASAASA